MIPPSFLQTLKARGIIIGTSHDDDLQDHLSGGSRTFYVGFDPTADSLHIGSLFQLVTIKRFMDAGHKPIIIVGGGTAAIGDPSGRTEMRSMLDDQTLEHNKSALTRQIQQILKQPQLTLLDNAVWLTELRYIDFMRDFGAHFKINQLIKKDIYRDRLEREEGLTMLELNYICFQAYDFLHLHQNYDCSLQLGGSDQWSNMLAGAELIQKKTGAKAFVAIEPLITRSDGKKMGKSAEGAVWLDANRTSAFDFYQYWLNIPDTDVEPFFRFFTFLDVPQIEQLMADDVITAKRRLAAEITCFVHGPELLSAAQEKTEQLFGTKGLAPSTELPAITIVRDSSKTRVDWFNTLAMSQMFGSNRNVRELIANGSLYIDGRKLSTNGADELQALLSMPEEKRILRVGKKHHYKLEL